MPGHGLPLRIRSPNQNLVNEKRGHFMHCELLQRVKVPGRVEVAPVFQAQADFRSVGRYLRQR